MSQDRKHWHSVFTGSTLEHLTWTLDAATNTRAAAGKVSVINDQDLCTDPRVSITVDLYAARIWRDKFAQLVKLLEQPVSGPQAQAGLVN